MAYSATKARIAGKIASGGFNQPDNTLAKAIDTGAGIMAQGIMKRGEEEREEKRIAKREAAAEAKRLAAAQRAKEAEAKKLARNAKVLALDFTGTADNVAAVTHFQKQLELMDGDVGAVISSTENRIKSGQLEFTAPTTEMVDTPFQGPNVPANAKLEDFGGTVGSNKFKDGTDATLADLPEIIANDKNSPSLRSQASEMNDMFGHLAEGTTLPEDGSVEVKTPGGVKIKPFVKQSEIDWMSVSQTDVENLRRLHDSGQQVLDAQDLKVLALYESDFAAAEAANVTAANVEISRKILLMGIEDLQGVLEATDDVYNKDMKVLAEKLLKKKQDDLQASEDEDAVQNNQENILNLSTKTPNDLKKIAAALNNSKNPSDMALHAVVTSMMVSGPQMDISQYFTGISTVKSTKARILEIENISNDILNEKIKNNIVSQLNAHIIDIQDEDKELKLTEEIFYGNIKDDKGNVIKIELVAKEGGSGFYSRTLGRSYEIEDLVPNSLISAENVDALSSQSAQIQEKVTAPLFTYRNDIQDLLRRSTAIDDIVKRSDGKVLTLLGGTLPSVLQVIRDNYTSLDPFIQGSADGTLYKNDILKISESSLPDPTTLDKIGVSADEYVRFQAQAIEFAYVYARTAMGQVRTTDKDFEAAFDVVISGSNYATFTKSLRDLVKKGYAKAETAHDQLLTHTGILAAKEIPNYERVFGTFVPLKDHLATQNIQAQLDWMNTEYQAPATQDGPPVSGAVTPLSVGQQVSKIKNLDTFSVFQKAYNNPNVNPEQRKKLAAELAKKHGITAAAVEQALTMGEPD